MPNDQIPPGEKHPTIGKSVEIDTLANQLLPTLLPISWRWRQQSPDYFVDYHVEVVEKGEPTGFQFGVQIKGTANADRRNNSIPYRMRKKELVYYRDNARLPIFVVLVDTTEKAAYWIFAQRYLRERAAKVNLDSKKTLTLQFDPADSLADLERFQKALNAAEKYLRDLFPGTPAAAVSMRERELRALDPEIGVNVSFIDGHEFLKLSPQKPISFTLEGLKPEASDAYQAMLKYGKTFKAEVQIKPPPSPLLQKLMSAREGVIHFEPEAHEGSVQIIYGGATVNVMQIDGKWRGGTKAIGFAGDLSKSPLRIELKIDVEQGVTASFGTPINLSEWENQQLLLLRSFNEIRSFVAALARGEEFRANYFIDGTLVGSFSATVSLSEEIQKIANTLDLLEKCRFVAKHYNVDPILPKLRKITYDQEREVEALWALATGSTAKDSIVGKDFAFSGSADFHPPSDWQDSRNPIAGTIKLVGGGVFDFLGHRVEVPGVEHILTDMKLVEFSINGSVKTGLFRGQDNSVWLRQRNNH